MMHYARFLILQMGFFAIFAGFMYNDLFGMVSLNLFESRFDQQVSVAGQIKQPLDSFDRTNTGNGDGPYPFGVDPAWHGSANELLYVNSLKMKLSVLIGVMQMTLGVFLRFSNAIHDKNLTDFFCECCPMLVFMLCFFGYMDYMIIYKWTHVIPGSHDAGAWSGPDGANGPPGIINSLICMAMHQEDHQPLWEGANDTASMLMLFAVLAVPVILAPKPFLLKSQHANKQKRKQEKADKDGIAVEDVEDDDDHGGGHGHGGEFEFGEVMIHQIIETIEYVLGTVSHTASYLRIWALSLAHQQLSLVFYSKTLQNGMTGTGDPVTTAVLLYFLFGAWFAATFAVLLMMDVLECFLHTLRLHWVEFQSKFYRGDGIKFAPYDIKKIVLAD